MLIDKRCLRQVVVLGGLACIYSGNKESAVNISFTVNRKHREERTRTRNGGPCMTHGLIELLKPQ